MIDKNIIKMMVRQLLCTALLNNDNNKNIEKCFWWKFCDCFPFSRCELERKKINSSAFPSIRNEGKMASSKMTYLRLFLTFAILIRYRLVNFNGYAITLFVPPNLIETLLDIFSKHGP